MLTQIKSVASTLGHGILDASAALHNASIDNQLTELDTQAEALRKQLASIENGKTKLRDQKI